MRVALVAVLAYPLVLLLRWGGKGAWTLQAATVIAALGAIATAFALRDRARVPSWGWVLALPVPWLVLGLIQILPLGWGHPVAAPDRVVLGVSPTSWAVDPDRAFEALVWRSGLLAWCLSVIVLRRIDAARIAGWLVVVAAAHALAAIVLAGIAPDLPFDNGYRGRVRGSFTYPNHAAAFWLMSLPLALLWAGRAARAGRPVAWLAPAVLGAALALSASRSGIILGLVVSLPVLWGALPRARRIPVAVLVLVLAAGALWLLNPAQTGERLAALGAGEGASLNGRFSIWRAAWPLVLGGGLLGYGAGGVRQLWRSTGEDAFEPATVHHLHNDLLQLVAEYGWLGVIGAVVVAVLALRWLRREWAGGRGWLQWGALSGMLSLLLYALVDFPWHSEALVTWWLALALLLVLARRDREQQAVRSTAAVRAACLGLGLLVLVLVPLDWRQEREAVRAWWVDRIAPAGAPVAAGGADAPALRAVLAAPAHSADLATARARLALDRVESDHAERAVLLGVAGDSLATAAQRAPAQPEAWLQRLRLARHTDDAALATAAAEGLLRRAPGWPVAQRELLRAHVSDLLDAATARDVAAGLLAGDQPHPPETFARLAAIIGPRELIDRLRHDETGPRLAASALPWLATSAPLETWRAAWRDWWTTSPGIRLSAEQWLPVADLTGAEPTDHRLRLPRTLAGTRQAAQRLQAAGLPLPPPLRATLAAHQPESLLLEAPDLRDPAAIEAQIGQLEQRREHSWIAARHEAYARLLRALTGDATALHREMPPDHLAAVVAHHDPDHPVGQRARLLLGLARSPRWRELERGRWTWWWHDLRSPPVAVRLPGWTALMVDGEFRGWHRGVVDLRLALEPGLHRVALVPAP